MRTAVLNKINRKYISGLLFGFVILIKPFAGFWDMKHEKKGNLKAAITYLIFLMIVSIMMGQYSGFIFNTNDVKAISIIDEITKILGPFILWCIASWSVTTLIDGEGSFQDIVMGTGYAIIPIFIARLLYLILSNVLLSNEGAILSVIIYIGTVWTILLVFSSTLVIHQFSATKNIFAIIVSFVVVGIIIFLGLLFINLIEQMYDYVYSIYRELLLRF